MIQDSPDTRFSYWRAFSSIVLGVQLGVLLGNVGFMYLERANYSGDTLRRNRDAMLVAISATYSSDPAQAATGCRIFDALAGSADWQAYQESVRIVRDRCLSKAQAG